MNSRKNITGVWILVLCIITSCIISCRNQEETTGDNVFTDDYGRAVTVPVHPQRIVSTSPAVTEIIYALGGASRLVGRTDFCTYPPEALEIESIGGISNLNIEKVISLKPDLVISGSMISKKITTQMEKLGVPTVCVIEKKNFDGLYENISKIGELIDRPEAADSLNRKLRLRVAQLPHKDKTTHGQTAYYVVGYGKSGNFTAGGNSYINDILNMSGLKNVAEDLAGWEYGLEALIEADPDYIIIRKEDSLSFCQMEPYTMLKAVKNGKVIAIESGMIDIQTPRNLEAIELLTQKTLLK